MGENGESKNYFILNTIYTNEQRCCVNIANFLNSDLTSEIDEFICGNLKIRFNAALVEIYSVSM